MVEEPAWQPGRSLRQHAHEAPGSQIVGDIVLDDAREAASLHCGPDHEPCVAERQPTWRLDRLGRSLQDLIAWAAWLADTGVALQSLQEVIDTSTSTGRLTFHLFGALAEFERNLIRDRTQAGLAAARARGRLGGRPKSLDADKRNLAVRLYDEKKLPISKIYTMMGISKPTLYAYVQAARKPGNPVTPPAPSPRVLIAKR